MGLAALEGCRLLVGPVALEGCCLPSLPTEVQLKAAANMVCFEVTSKMIDEVTSPVKGCPRNASFHRAHPAHASDLLADVGSAQDCRNGFAPYPGYTTTAIAPASACAPVATGVAATPVAEQRTMVPDMPGSTPAV